MASAQFPVIFEGEKYDLNKFLRDHPGGTNTLMKYKGLSILQGMEKYGHSTNAYHMLKDFKVDKDVYLTGEVSENGRILTKDEGKKDVKEIAFLEELESRLDWSQPLLAQLGAIAPHYDKWMNSPVYRKCRIFKSPFLEILTFTPWYVVPIFWVPIIFGLGVQQFYEHVACGACQPALSVPQFVYHILTGVLIWTALEYCLHRWVFHLNPGSSISMIKIHFLIHGLHHKVPFDELRQVFPPIPAFLLTYILFTPMSQALSYPYVKLIGALMGYLAYDMIHFYVHHGSPTDGTYLYSMKRYHSNHHFVNHDKAFGISSKLWDYVFKTIVHVRKLGFSLKW